MMVCLCRCFHLLRIMCSITLQRTHVSEIGPYLGGSDLRLILCIGDISVWSQPSGNLEVLYNC